MLWTIAGIVEEGNPVDVVEVVVEVVVEIVVEVVLEFVW